MGYGQFSIRRSYSVSAHRVAWELTHGPIPAGMFVLHHCDNKPCVRPDHLFLGTAAENTRDMMNKKREGWKAYTPGFRAAVVRRCQEGITQKQVAREFGISHGSVSNWVRGS